MRRVDSSGLPPVRVAAALAVMGALLVGGSSSVHAQTSDTEIEGARDFRTAPVVVDGVYRDTILAGETLWYGVYLTNGSDETFEVSSRLTEGSTNVELELELIGPTLSGARRTDGNLAVQDYWYGSRNDGMSWLWFLKYTLTTEGRLGQEFVLEFTVNGAADYNPTPCASDPDCDLADRAEELQQAIDRLEGQIATGGLFDVQVTEENEALDAEIAALTSEKSDLEAILASLSDELPEPPNGATGATRPLPLAVALVLLNVGLFGFSGFALWRRHARGRDSLSPRTAVLSPSGSGDDDPGPSEESHGSSAEPVRHDSGPSLDEGGEVRNLFPGDSDQANGSGLENHDRLSDSGDGSGVGSSADPRDPLSKGTDQPEESDPGDRSNQDPRDTSDSPSRGGEISEHFLPDAERPEASELLDPFRRDIDAPEVVEPDVILDQSPQDRDESDRVGDGEIRDPFQAGT